MKKRVFGRYFSRARKSRQALFRSLALALVKQGKIVTTRTKAQVLAGFIEKQLVVAKRGNLAAVRKLMANLGNDRPTVQGLITLAKASARSSGFTRVIPLSSRRGDLAQMARIELVDGLPPKEEKKRAVKPETAETKVKTAKAVKKVVTKKKI